MKRIYATIIAILSILVAWYFKRSKITRWVTIPVITSALVIGGVSTFIAMSPEIPADAYVAQYLEPGPNEQIRTGIFWSSGNWTNPGVDKIFVEAWGQGGSGLANTGGGGGACYSAKLITGLNGDEVFPVVVPPVATTADTDGLSATFATTTVVAPGGKSASNGGLGCDADDAIGDIKFSGGNAHMGTVATLAMGGGGAGQTGNGLNGTTNFNSGSGGRTAGGKSSTGSGADYGAGGGYTTSGSGLGGRGFVRVYWIEQVPSGFPYVVDKGLYREISFGGINHTANMPTTHSAGDMLVMMISIDGTRSITSVTGDWSLVSTTTEGQVTGAVYYKFATSSTTPAPVITLNSSSVVNIAVYSIRDAGAIDVRSSTGSSANASFPTFEDLPHKKRLWLAFTSWDANVLETRIFQMPSDPINSQFFRNLTHITHSVNLGVITGIGESQTESTYNNIGPWNSTNEQWVSYSIAIDPLEVEESPFRLKILNSLQIKNSLQVR